MIYILKKRSILLSLAGNSGRLIRVRHIRLKSSATHSCQCVQHFPVSRQWYGYQCLGFLTCAHTLMYAIAHGGCTDTVREPALEENSLAASRTRTRVSIAPGFSVRRSTNRAIPTEICTKIKTGRLKPNVCLHGHFVAPSQSVVLLTIARSVANVIQNGSLPRHRTQLATMVHYVQYSYLSWRRGKKSVTV